jgi:hypothetical protein
MAMGLILTTIVGCRRPGYLPPSATNDSGANTDILADAGQTLVDVAPQTADAGQALVDAASQANDTGLDVPLADDSRPDRIEPEAAVDVPELDTAPASLSPGQLDHLVLWLEEQNISPEGAEGRVTAWKDSSPNHLLATPNGPGPWLVADAHLGRYGVRFGLKDGKTTRLLVPDHPSLRWGTGDFLLGIVARYRNTALPKDIPNEYGLLVAKVDTAGPPIPGPGLWGNNAWPVPETTEILFQTVGVPEQVTGTRSAGYNDDRIHLIIGIRDGQQLRVRVDGVETRRLITTVPDISAEGYPLAIGAHPDGPAQQLDGDVFEVFALSSSIPADQLRALERHMAAKYDIPGIQ